MSKTLISLFLAVAVSSGQYLGKNTENIDVFRINLNDEPNQRFREPALRYKDKIVDLLNRYEPLIPTMLIEVFTYLDWGIKWYHMMLNLKHLQRVMLVLVKYQNYSYLEKYQNKYSHYKT